MPGVGGVERRRRASGGAPRRAGGGRRPGGRRERPVRALRVRARAVEVARQVHVSEGQAVLLRAQQEEEAGGTPTHSRTAAAAAAATGHPLTDDVTRPRIFNDK